MVLLIVRHSVGRLVEAVVGGWGLACAVQPRKLGGADLLRAGGAGEPAAMLHPTVLTGAAGGGQEALGHAASLMTARRASRSPIHHTCGRQSIMVTWWPPTPRGSRQMQSSANTPLRPIAGFVILSCIRVSHMHVGSQKAESTRSSSVRKINQMKGHRTSRQDTEFLLKRARCCKRFHFDWYQTENLNFS